MIELKNVKKTFGRVVALENLSCTVQKGSIYGLIGYNGSGKTTLLKIVAGIFKSDSGTVRVAGQDVFDNADVKQRIFLIPDEHFFISQATLHTMAAFYRGFYPNWSDNTYNRLTELFALDPAAKLNGFSKGMQQQAAIILALSTRPDYLLLDECFDGLDPLKRSLVRQLLTEFMAEKEMSVMISSHNIRELEDICDSIGLINKNRIIYDSSVDEMREKINKYRVVLPKDITPENFAGHQYKDLHIEGKVVTFVANGNTKDIKARMEILNPVLFDSIPLTLEEIFLIEMEEKDYDFTGLIE